MLAILISSTIMAALAGLTWSLYWLCSYEYFGYALFGLGLIAKVVLWATGVEPFQVLMVVKIFSVVPFVIIWQYLRFHYDEESCWKKAFLKVFPCILVINVIEPAAVNEVKAGIYVNAINGLFIAILSILEYYWSGQSIENEILYGKKADYTYPILYTLWHLVFFYWLTVETKDETFVFEGNYFMMDLYSLSVPLAVSYFSQYGPREWFQTRAFTLTIRLFLLSAWVSTGSAEVFDDYLFHPTFNQTAHDAFQIFVLLAFLMTFSKKLHQYLTKPNQMNDVDADI